MESIETKVDNKIKQKFNEIVSESNPKINNTII